MPVRSSAGVPTPAPGGDTHPDRPFVEPDSAQLSALVDASPDAITIVDGSWRFTYANVAFERLSQSTDAIRGRTLWDAYPFLVGTPLEQRLRDVMDARQPDRLEFHGERGAYEINVM